MLPQDETSTEEMATKQAMNGERPASPVSGYIPPTPMMTPSVTATPVMSTPSTNGNGSYKVTVPAAPAPSAEITGDYSAYVLNVNAPWPPPVFARPTMRPEERFYLENRWFSQWSFYDRKATVAKRNYLIVQRIVVIGSVIVPILVGFGPTFATNFPGLSRFFIDMIVVFISGAVAVAAAIEGLYKFSDSWTTYRRAAEEMQQEKFMFDVRTGRYTNNADAFTRFVERCEEIMAQQNGRFIQTIEKQQAEAAEQNQEILAKYRDNGSTTVSVNTPSNLSSTVLVETEAPAGSAG